MPTDDDIFDLYAQLNAYSLALRQLLKAHPEVAQSLVRFADIGELPSSTSREIIDAAICRQHLRAIAGPIKTPE